ncbi:MAG TPA: alcohol dehydrogenase catalytic domain-containing protein [Armatimonadota bacterium]|nr:alcohol dehydrogenase catalytic domain-containing protein [Armatimonadota bacterium]
MKAMKLTGIRQMEMVDVPMPTIQHDTDVLIHVTTVGVCGSDIHYYVDGKIGSQVVQYPFTVGHEGAGIVTAVGSAVTHVKPGDRIAIEPAMPCFTCDQCRAGRHHTCRHLRFLGCPGQAEGCLSEYIVMPETSCYPIPDSMSFDEAAISEPLTIGVYAVKSSIPLAGATVGILGAGPIGLSVLLPAKAQGAQKVMMTDKIDRRLQVAQAAGADWVGNPLSTDVVSDITRIEPQQLDVVFECCGDQAALDQAIELLKPGGKLMIVGIPSVDRVSFSIDRLRRKEICVQNVRRQNHCVQPALDMIARHDFDVMVMATHRFSFADTKEAFDLVAEYRDGVVKALIEFD